MEIESEPSVSECPPNPQKPQASIISLVEEFPRPPPAKPSQQLYESSVNRYISTAEREMATGRATNLPSNQPIIKDAFQLQSLLSTYAGRTESNMPSQFIVSRVLDIPTSKEPTLQSLSTSRLELLVQNRRVNRQVSPEEIPGLLPRPAIAASTSGTQATVNFSRQLPPASTITPLLPSSLSLADKPHEKKYTKLCEMLTNEGYEVMIEENPKDVNSFYPDLLVTVSPQQRKHYNRYGDVLHFQIFGQNFQPCRLGVFTVFNCNRQPLLAGYALIFSHDFNSYHRMIEFFLHIHGAEPESILTSS